MISGSGVSSNQFGAAYFRGAGQIAALQNALKAYAMANGDVNSNPGAATDSMNDSTVIAALYTVWKVADKVPGIKSIKSALSAVPGVGSLLNIIIGNPLGLLVGWGMAKSQAPAVAADISKFIESHANEIAIGVNVAAGAGVGVNTGIPGAAAVQFYTPARSMINKGGVSKTAKLAAYDPKLGAYRVAIPKGLGATAATHQEIAPSPTAPGDAQLVSLPVLETAVGAKPWYKQPLVWLGIGVGVVGLGAGTYYLVK